MPRESEEYSSSSDLLLPSSPDPVALTTVTTATTALRGSPLLQRHHSHALSPEHRAQRAANNNSNTSTSREYDAASSGAILGILEQSTKSQDRPTSGNRIDHNNNGSTSSGSRDNLIMNNKPSIVGGSLPGIKVGALFFPYKYVALILLMVQTTSSILILRLSRTYNTEQGAYLSTTAVVMSEVFKLFGSFFLLARETKKDPVAVFNYTVKEISGNWVGTLKLGVPALLYTVQNNLLFIALSNLSAATYQVTYQLKILTTAIFSVTMLSKAISGRQWLSLLTLTIGVALVQMPKSSDGSDDDDGETAGNAVVGLIAVLSACCSSGFAGVYFEKILKGTKQSLWLRNIQLSLFSIVLGLIGVALNDWDKVAADGFFQNYNSIAWTAISLQAFGGLIIAAVIKFADNILKGFANSISIILTGVLSFVLLGDFELTPFFFLGTMLVVFSTFMYGHPSSQPKPKPTLPVQ